MLSRQSQTDISIHAPLRERPFNSQLLILGAYISIHAPLRERPICFDDSEVFLVISIHAPLRERRWIFISLSHKHFISIHAPLRERPITPSKFTKKYYYFNPRSLAGATRAAKEERQAVAISIHAPLRERPICFDDSEVFLVISIHAPLRERPITPSKFTKKYYYFNPRSLAGATRAAKEERQAVAISIHAPLRERQ